MDDFDCAWETLAQESKCDALGGMEYTRIRKMWVDRGSLLACLMFIMREANRPPEEISAAERKAGAP